MMGCRGRAELASCDDDLRGVYVAADGKRWDVIAGSPGALEAYPLFDDGALAGDVVVSPRVIDLARTPSGVAGFVRRWYMRGADRCDAAVSVHVTACRGDELELVMKDPVAPLSFATCAFPRPDGSRVERWHRER
ncbi:MAG: hypothetical protein KF773_42100 [Deltaproteobacteria bacterium]|nr:hypothetical protein [Deltaproteobacteria bacterium]